MERRKKKNYDEKLIYDHRVSVKTIYMTSTTQPTVCATEILISLTLIWNIRQI